MKKYHKDCDSLELYLKEINKFPILTREQERELAIKIQDGDLQARENLMNSNLRFVVKIAKGYQNCGLPLEDLIAEGNVGLIKAIEKYDISQNVKFISYAVWWISQTIMKSLSNSSHIRIPYNKIAKLRNIKNYQEDGFSNKEIAKKMKMKLEDVNYLINISANFLSLESPVISEEDSSDKLSDRIIDVKDFFEFEKNHLEKSLVSIMDKYLTEKEADILKMRFGFYDGEFCTLDKVGEKYNVTRERVRQVEQKALNKLREYNSKLQLESCLGN